MCTQVSKINKEPSLSAMLADPIIRLVVARDGIVSSDIDRLIASVRAKLGGNYNDCRQIVRGVALGSERTVAAR